MGLTRLVLCFVVIASVVHVPSALAAQIGAAGDLKEVQEYRLTEPALKQVMAATRNMLVAMKNDPRYQRLTKLEAELKTLDAKDQPTDADTKRMEKSVEELAEIEAAVAKEPLVANALKSAGISARDYAKFMGAFIQAAMIQGLQKDGAIKEIPKDVIPENVKFAKEHAAEFAAFMKELEAFETKEP
jgi:hypothetical protein